MGVLVPGVLCINKVSMFHNSMVSFRSRSIFSLNRDPPRSTLLEQTARATRCRTRADQKHSILNLSRGDRSRRFCRSQVLLRIPQIPRIPKLNQKAMCVVVFPQNETNIDIRWVQCPQKALQIWISNVVCRSFDPLVLNEIYRK